MNFYLFDSEVWITYFGSRSKMVIQIFFVQLIKTIGFSSVDHFPSDVDHFFQGMSCVPFLGRKEEHFEAQESWSKRQTWYQWYPWNSQHHITKPILQFCDLVFAISLDRELPPDFFSLLYPIEELWDLRSHPFQDCRAFVLFIHENMHFQCGCQQWEPVEVPRPQLFLLF